MSNNIKLEDLPSPDKLESLDSLPSPDEIQAKTSEQPTEAPGKLESLLRGGAQGLSFGLADELAGAMANPIGAAQQAGEYLHLTDANTPAAEEYRIARNQSRQAYQQAEEANPITSLAGNVAGAIIPALLTLGGSTAATGAAKAAQAAEMAPEALKALQTLNNIQTAAKTGAIAGGAFGVGQDTGEQLSPKSLIRDIATGATTGAALPILGAGAGKLHEGLKGKSTTYEELSRILGKTLGGEKLLGTEAKNEALQKFKNASDELTSELSSARNKVGKSVSEAKAAEPEKNIADIISSLKSGITGAAEQQPMASKSAPALDKVQTKIEDLTRQYEGRLSDSTKKLIALQEKSKSISAFNPEKRSNIGSQIAKAESSIQKLKDDFSNKISKVQDQKAQLISDMVSEPKSKAIYGSAESEEAASKVSDIINRLEQRAKLQGEDLTQASPELVEDVVSNLKNISPAGQSPLKSPEISKLAEEARKGIKGLDSEALKQAKQQYSKLAEADQALTGRSSDYLNADKTAREDSIFKKMIQASKDNQTADLRNLQLSDQANLLKEAGQEELANKVTGLSKGVGQKYIDTLRVNPKNLHENIIPKSAAIIGEVSYATKQIPGQVISKLKNSPYSGPALQKVDEMVLQNKISRSVADTFKQAISSEDSGKRNAAINTMLQSPTYRRLMKELFIPGSEDGEQTN